MVYDGFIQAKDPCNVERGSIPRLCHCYILKCIFVSHEEFEKSVDYTLFDSNTKVFVVGKRDQMKVTDEESR